MRGEGTKGRRGRGLAGRAGLQAGVWMLVAVAAMAAALPGAAAAQQEEEVDSARLRILDRLQKLGRPPGYDSVLYVQDSVARAQARQSRAAGGAGQDSTLAAILTMPGFAVTEYQGGAANFGAAERRLVLEAQDGEGQRARVNREGNDVQADSSITYSEASGLVRTVGPSTFNPAEGDAVDALGLVFDLTAGRGSAFAARTTYQQGSANWKVTGDMPYASPDSTFMHNAIFTSCELEEPHYHFETDEIKIVGGNVLVARPVRLYFADVPVAWLPFVAQSLSSGRSSGLLTPRFSVNDIVRTSGGYRRRVSNLGFYWAMSDYSDALVAFDWFSDNFLAMTGSMRYRFNRQFLDGNLSFRRYWRATGNTEFALNTRHSWEMDERTQLRVSGNYTTSTDFVRQNSFDPREVTQSIDSEGGLSRRFDWGSLNLGANRKEYLSDDRVEWTLPSANLSLSTITLFRAPSAEASFYNNMTWSGSMSFNRRTVDRLQPDTFELGLANTANTTGSVSSNLSIGNLSFRQSLDLAGNARKGVPEAYLLHGDTADPELLLTGAPARDITDTKLSWQTSVDYQQQLMGSTTLTPQLSISGRQFKSDTSQVARNFVSAPSRVSFGARLKTDIYGFWPGFGGYETIRHKLSPSFDYQWSPEVEPDQLQREVFGSRVLQPKNAVSVTLNQTWEAKKASAEDTAQAAEGESGTAQPGAQPAGQPGGAGAEGEGPRRREQAEIVNLLALRTSVVRYDFVEADSLGSFLQGFETTRLSNAISSDFLRGLSMSVDHDLFEDGEKRDGSPKRRFKPHLSSVNFSFSLSSRSGIFRWLSALTGGEVEEEEAPEDEEEPLEEEDPFASEGATDEASVIPGASPQRQTPVQRAGGRGGGGRRGWNANFSYSLQRPRDESRPASQMLSGTLTLSPTEHWEVSWRTAYDLEAGQFNDHTIRLSRNLHRWTANFDFLQTATGNWTFRFNVSLMDNRDLKFDYEQRNLDVGRPASERR